MPVIGRVKTPLTIENVLKKITDYDIYRYYIGHDFILQRAMHSPMRRDDNPSFTVILGKTGKLTHLDYAHEEYRGDALDFVCQLFNLTPSQALLKIDKDFGLGISSTETKTGEWKKIIETHKPVLEVVPKKKIVVVSRPFNKVELAYWASYHITPDVLISHDVYAVKELYLDRKRYPLRSDLCFAYKFLVNGEVKWKIYWPERKKLDKWLSNVPNLFMSGMNHITDHDKFIIVTKAKKDEMVLSLFLPRVVSVQSEGIHSINNENLDILQKIPNRWINFDPDETGIKASKYFNQFGFGWINCPSEYKDPKGKAIKDFADLGKYYGLETVMAYFRRKGIPIIIK